MFHYAELRSQEGLTELNQKYQIRSPEPNIGQSPMTQRVSLIIPVYNEAPHLERFLKVIDGLELPIGKELVIVDDGSTDGSKEILEAFPFQSQTILISQPGNQGKGAAVREGIQQATGDFIGIQDADLETNPDEIPDLLNPLIEGRADVVCGSRFKKSGHQVHRTFHYLVNRILTMLSNIMSDLYLSDMQTCYKFFRADVIKNIRLETNRFGFDPEITAKIARLKLRILEVPVSYFPRKYLEGKKMHWKDGIAQIWHIIYFNLWKGKANCFAETLPRHFLPGKDHWL
jgi:glycosyltransferase involved in cell wall biosynthesis